MEGGGREGGRGGGVLDDSEGMERAQKDGGMVTEPGWRDVEREREERVGEGGTHCLFPGDSALPALRGRRHDNQHGCRCHSFIAPLLSSPSPPFSLPPSFHSVSALPFFFLLLLLSFTAFHISFFIF